MIIKSCNLKAILGNVLKNEYRHIGYLLDSGFNLSILSSLAEVRLLAIDYLEEYAKSKCLDVVLYKHPSQLSGEDGGSGMIHETKQKVLVSDRWPDHGQNFIRLSLDKADLSFPSLSTVVLRTLESYGFAAHQEIFSAEIMNKLKSIYTKGGYLSVISATIQLAYWLGECSNETRANEAIAEMLSGRGTAKRADSTELFRWISVNVNDPQAFLKSAFAQFAVDQLGMTVSQISRKWQVSRSTIRCQLERSEELGVINFFKNFQG